MCIVVALQSVNCSDEEQAYSENIPDQWDLNMLHGGVAGGTICVLYVVFMNLMELLRKTDTNL